MNFIYSKHVHIAAFARRLLLCIVFRPYFDASGSISNCSLYLHANVRNIKAPEYNAGDSVMVMENRRLRLVYTDWQVTSWKQRTKID